MLQKLKRGDVRGLKFLATRLYARVAWLKNIVASSNSNKRHRKQNKNTRIHCFVNFSNEFKSKHFKSHCLSIDALALHRAANIVASSNLDKACPKQT